jgi:hypothetical protein
MTIDPKFLEDLQQEQDAFDAALPKLLREHRGEFVVFKDRKPVGFYPSYDDAYAMALDRYGHEAVFLISEVVQRIPQPVSLSWNAGVLFGK